jgi:hypothetical protein
MKMHVVSVSHSILIAVISNGVNVDEIFIFFVFLLLPRLDAMKFVIYIQEILTITAHSGDVKEIK